MEKQYIRSKKALEILESKGINITSPTLLIWAKKGEFVKKVGGTWFFDHYKLLEFVKNGEKKS